MSEDASWPTDPNQDRSSGGGGGGEGILLAYTSITGLQTFAYVYTRFCLSDCHFADILLIPSTVAGGM